MADSAVIGKTAEKIEIFIFSSMSGVSHTNQALHKLDKANRPKPVIIAPEILLTHRSP
jgi:hypothetical protein